MERDVICGMQVDPAKAAGTSEYQGKTYYFCSKGCKAKFDAKPCSESLFDAIPWRRNVVLCHRTRSPFYGHARVRDGYARR